MVQIPVAKPVAINDRWFSTACTVGTFMYHIPNNHHFHFVYTKKQPMSSSVESVCTLTFRRGETASITLYSGIKPAISALLAQRFNHKATYSLHHVHLFYLRKSGTSIDSIPLSKYLLNLYREWRKSDSPSGADCGMHSHLLWRSVLLDANFNLYIQMDTLLRSLSFNPTFGASLYYRPV